MVTRQKMGHVPTLALQGLRGLILMMLVPASAIAKGPDSESNFAPFGENFALFGNRMSNRGWASSDERALRGHFSFKYTVFGDPYVPLRSRASGKADSPNSGWEIFLAYTGQFDFYMLTRESGPVINRLSNPAVYARFPLKPYLDLGDRDDNAYLSLEHRSNGQTGDATTPRGQESAQRAYEARDRYYFDAVSRGSNYLALTLELTDLQKVQGLDLSVKLRHHFDREDAVTWGPESQRRRSLHDYDRVSALLSWKSRWGWFDVAWRGGDGLAHTDSWTLGYQVPFADIPLYVRAHRGPMNTLSNYTQQQNSFGVGLRFARPIR
jgi:hypothetical protein